MKEQRRSEYYVSSKMEPRDMVYSRGAPAGEGYFPEGYFLARGAPAGEGYFLWIMDVR